MKSVGAPHATLPLFRVCQLLFNMRQCRQACICVADEAPHLLVHHIGYHRPTLDHKTAEGLRSSLREDGRRVRYERIVQQMGELGGFCDHFAQLRGFVSRTSARTSAWHR